jgi:hypothetical protein
MRYLNLKKVDSCIITKKRKISYGIIDCVLFIATCHVHVFILYGIVVFFAQFYGYALDRTKKVFICSCDMGTRIRHSIKCHSILWIFLLRSSMAENITKEGKSLACYFTCFIHAKIELCYWIISIDFLHCNYNDWVWIVSVFRIYSILFVG